jgi:endonuclease YncB( thermonuclease family)
MGWRFRFGPRFARLNFTKSGVSVSTGLPGYRVTFGPKGTRHTTYMPGTGVSYSAFTPQQQAAAPPPSSPAPPPKRKGEFLALLVLGCTGIAVAAMIYSHESVEKMDGANVDVQFGGLEDQDSNRREIVSSGRITSDVVRVIDGDTIRIGHQKPDVRLVGFNAPETRRAQCEAERRLGDRATARLRDLVRSSKLEFEFVRCSCPPGTEGTSSCNYGRRCGTLKANGQDVGLILIRENLAVPFICGQTRCPPTPKPWCK